MHAFLFLYPMSKHNNNQKKKRKKRKKNFMHRKGITSERLKGSRIKF